MSGVINKIKEKIAEVKGDHHTTGSTNAGPHNSNIANSADPRVDSDLSGGSHGGLNQTTGAHHTTGTGLTGTSGTHHATGTGIHTTSGIGSSGANTTAGPHNSDTLNKLDPRVDSDLSGGHPGSHTGHSTTSGSAFGGTSTHNASGSTFGSSGTHSNTTAGPHSSNLANKLDPRVDSDLSGGHPGSNATYTATGATGTSGSTFGTSGSHNIHGSTNAGPHSSNLANAADPRVDSDLSGGHVGSNAAYTTTGNSGSTFGSTGTHHHTTGTGLGSSTHGSTNAGPHSSNVANKLDPRVDSDLDRSNNAGLNQHTHHTGTGLTGSNTSSGPVHNSALLNKLDPRVDSDADGSRNAGAAQVSTTHNAGASTY